MAKWNLKNDIPMKRFRSIWSALLWRGVVYGIPMGFVVGALVGVVVGALEQPGLIPLVWATLEILIVLPISLVITIIVLKKYYDSVSTEPVRHDRAA